MGLYHREPFEIISNGQIITFSLVYSGFSRSISSHNPGIVKLFPKLRLCGIINTSANPYKSQKNCRLPKRKSSVLKNCLFFLHRVRRLLQQAQLRLSDIVLFTSAQLSRCSVWCIFRVKCVLRLYRRRINGACGSGTSRHFTVVCFRFFFFQRPPLDFGNQKLQAPKY